MVFVFYFVDIGRQILIFLIFVRVLSSWFNWKNGFIYDTTEWMLQPFRRLIPPVGGVLDISPILLLLVIEFTADLLLSILGSLVG
ncbi:YggT family protein [Patescibacteria group bacterium]|nr:YggT family protein [Patescibacteria group bacterium]